MLLTLVGKEHLQIMVPERLNPVSERLNPVFNLDRTHNPNRTINIGRTRNLNRIKVLLGLRCRTSIWDPPEVLSMGHCLNGHRVQVQKIALLIQETGP